MNINSNSSKNNNFQIQISEDNQEKNVIEAEIEEEIKPIALPDTDSKDNKGNTLLCLENALIEKFGYKDLNRDVALQKIQTEHLNMKKGGVHGKLPKKDPLDADSKIEFETYEFKLYKFNKDGTLKRDEKGDPVYIPSKGLKLKMTWQINIIDKQGNPETLTFEQYLKTGPRCLLPDNLADEKGVEHAKHKALLYAKMHRKLHKQALLGKDNYQLDQSRLKPVAVDKIIETLRAKSHLDIYHIPDYEHRGIEAISRALYKVTHLARGDTASITQIHLKDGSKLELLHGKRWKTKGRALRYFKGDINDKTTWEEVSDKSQAAFSKYIKIQIHDRLKDDYVEISPPNIFNRGKKYDPTGRSYEHHFYSQAGNAVIKDSEIDAYKDLYGCKASELEKKIEERNIELGKQPSPQKIDKKQIRNYKEAEAKNLVEHLKKYSSPKLIQEGNKRLGNLQKAIKENQNIQEHYDELKQVYNEIKEQNTWHSDLRNAIACVGKLNREFNTGIVSKRKLDKYDKRLEKLKKAEASIRKKLAGCNLDEMDSILKEAKNQLDNNDI